VKNIDFSGKVINNKIHLAAPKVGYNDAKTLVAQVIDNTVLTI
jgi:hypothetical protein